MNTSREISTISYNSQEFLIMKLEELLEKHIISYYMLINHFAEEDEKKNHIHLFLKPNKKLDTMDLQKNFIEFDSANIKPLKCLDFRVSNSDDWILYNLHYGPYLASKFESRKFHYTVEEIISSDEDNLEYLYHHAMHGSEFAQKKQLLDALNDSTISAVDLIRNGTVSLSQANNLRAFREMLIHSDKYDITCSDMQMRDKLDRGGRKNHG